VGPQDGRDATTTLEHGQPGGSHGAPRALGPILFRLLCGDDLSQPPARYALAPFRDLFGDPGKDYDTELQRHYKDGPPPDWQSAHVSMYATMHPWEDWAETWAHYLHIVDTLGTARSYGMALRPEPLGLPGPPRVLTFTARRLDFDDFEDLLRGWFPLTFALNSLNRGMGLLDLYPFVLSERAIEKLRFVHDVIERARVST